MTVKLMLLKSGEDLIADVTEMVYGEGESTRVVGYYFNKPCLVRMRNPGLVEEDDGKAKKSGFEVSLYPWLPLSADERIPVPADWLVTMVEPTAKLKEMYEEDVINHGKETNESVGTDEQSDSNQSD
jgi:hypothetical protein